MFKKDGENRENVNGFLRNFVRYVCYGKQIFHQHVCASVVDSKNESSRVESVHMSQVTDWVIFSNQRWDVPVHYFFCPLSSRTAFARSSWEGSPNQIRVFSHIFSKPSPKTIFDSLVACGLAHQIKCRYDVLVKFTS